MASGGYIYTSNDYGVTWVQKTSDAMRSWSSITSDSTGQYLAAAVSGGYIYTSNDYGATWVQKTSDQTRSWRSITSDSTGQYLAAVVAPSGCGGGCAPYSLVYTSNDFGDTWIGQAGTDLGNWYSITSNSTGQYLAAVVGGGYIYTSNNYGVTWLQKTSDQTRSWRSITSDSTGQYLAAVVDGGYIYTSNDYGATWVQKTSDATRQWSPVMCTHIWRFLLQWRNEYTYG